MRAKFHVENVTSYSTGAIGVLLMPIRQGPDDTQNTQFWKATPNGKLEMCITNPDAKDFFKPGAEYYIDFTQA